MNTEEKSEQADNASTNAWASGGIANLLLTGSIIVTLIVGLGTLIWQSNETAKQIRITRELSYDVLWTDYMDLGIQYPLFVGGLDEKTYLALNDEEKIRYAWIFDRLVFAAESILALDYDEFDEAAWRDVFEYEIGKHKALIENDPNIIPVYFCQNDGVVRELIASASTKAAAQSESCS